MKKYYMIKKWLKILFKKSDLHKEQGVGEYYSKDKVEGYYNNLKHKVNWGLGFDINGIPLVEDSEGNKLYFTITIAQYGLGCYDKYLESKEKKYLENFFLVADYLMNTQDEMGGYDVSKSLGCKYSSMAQGESVSVLLRAYLKTKQECYLQKAKHAYECMVRPLNKLGTQRIKNGSIYYEEFATEGAEATVLNGWIFSIFGLIDYFKIVQNKETEKLLKESIKSLYENIEYYDVDGWSYYSLDKKIASPFYHKLHINQLKVLNDLYPDFRCEKIIQKWEKTDSRSCIKIKMITKKIIQKLKDPGKILIKN